MAATVTTMSTKAEASPAGPSHRLAAAFIIVIGSLMLAVSLPHAAAQFIAIRNSAVFEDVTAAEADDSFAKPLAAQRRAAAIFPSSDILADLALLEVAAARQKQNDWQSAEAALKAALAQRPLDGLGWARLAYVYEEQGKTAWACDALARSIESASYITGFMQWRFSLALKLWPSLEPAQQQLVAQQAHMIWKKKRYDFIRLARIAAFAPQIEAIMQQYYPAEFESFLQRRGKLRHNP